jgi:hypothetical protein
MKELEPVAVIVAGYLALLFLVFICVMGVVFYKSFV